MRTSKITRAVAVAAPVTALVLAGSATAAAADPASAATIECIELNCNTDTP